MAIIGIGNLGITPINTQDNSPANTAGLVNPTPELGKPGEVNPDDTKAHPGRKSSPDECKTCKERKYQDGSNEMVSFKAASHISPEAAGGAVRAHEGEHVSNAYKKAAQGGGKVLQASVAIHTAVCPECGRTYVAGGTTTTKIKYNNEDNPYTKNLKNSDNGLLSGMNLDTGV